jgi:uncharacterized protein (TIGR03663 family)
MTDTTTTPEPEAAETDADHPAKPSRRRQFVAWLRNRDRLEIAIWVGLIVLAFVLRMWDVGSRPFHHDESQDAYFSFTFSKDFGSYEYNPLLHGPLRFYLTALNYKLFGDSNVTARLAPAYMGTLLVALPYLLRHQLGRVAAVAAGVILAVSPSILYFSRFAREDIYLAAITLAIMVTAFRFVRRPHALTLSLLGALCALSFATKESGLVSIVFVGGFFVIAAIVHGVRARRTGAKYTDGEVLRAVMAVRWTGWVYAIATLLFVYSAMFTVFFTHTTCMTTEYAHHPAHQTSCLNAVQYGLGYWRAQQAVARGGDSPWLYISILFGEEWPVVLLAAVGAVFTFLRPTTLRLFLVWMFVCTLAFYCWGSERFAWLVIHPLVPLVLLAGVGLQGLWQLRSRVARLGACAAVAIGAVYLVGASYSANAKQGADPRSLLVSTQSSVQVKQVADQVDKLVRDAKQAGRPPLTITIDSSQGATFPYAWYFRHDQVGYIDMTTDGYVPNTQVLVMTIEARDKLKPNLSAYAGRPFDFRVWWVKDYKKKFSTTAWWDWFTHRKAWNPTGGMPEWLYVRRDVGPVPGKGTKSAIPPPAPPPPAPKS